MPTDSIVCTTPMTAATIPKAGKPSPTLGRHGAFVMVRLDFVIHQVFDLEGIHVARYHQAQVIGHEFDDVVVGQHGRILGKQRTFLRAVDIAFDRHQAFLAHLAEHLEQQGHQLHVQFLGVARALEQAGQGGQGGLDRLVIVTNKEGAQGGAADHQQLDRLEQRRQMAARQRETAKNRGADDDVSDYD